jgi:hypothetical protein
VVWNPAFVAGSKLATAVYDWFGGPNRVWHRNGLGVPVMFWTSEDAQTPPSEIPTGAQDFTVVVPLVDEHFAAKRAWRDWIATNVPDDPDCHILFWAVHPAAFQIERLSRINPLGTRECTAEALRRLLTESCSLLLVANRKSRSVSPLTFFISYARKDGTSIAADVRRALLDYGNVQVFMDVHDIEPGRGWQERLARGLEDGAAMLAIVTDEYSERAWCRHELREFRTPVPEKPDRSKQPGAWWLRPVFVLDALSGNRTRSMFEIGSAPTTRWQQEAATAIIDSLIRDVLFGEVQRLRAARVKSDGAELINWVPDTWTLLELQRLKRFKKSLRVVYPGDGLPRVEIERLQEVFPGLKLQSFEETM